MCRTTIQMNKLTNNVNWTLVNGDGYCGYQALHAVAMHAEGKSYPDISKNIQTKEKPYKLLAFLQSQTSKLQSISMKGALTRVQGTINVLKRSQPITKHSWCPTEIVAHLLPTIQVKSNYWNHSKPPTGSYEWISTYYNPTWLENEAGLDIVYNGLDHYTIQMNTRISPKEIKEGINNLVNEIINCRSIKDEWSTIRGQRISRMKKLPMVIDLASSDEEFKEVISKRAQRNSRHKSQVGNNGYKKTEQNNSNKSNMGPNSDIVTPYDRVLREPTEVNYAPEYHPLDDAFPPSMVPEIPFPKDQRKDQTSRKDLVFAPSRIGTGLGVYTLSNIPKGAVIMEYVDELKEVIMKRDILDGIRDMTYMYANHKTNVYINASNNVHSYCGLVNEALEDSNFNTVLCETRDKDGTLRVLFKAARNITAKEDIGTRYSVDGSYWDNSKTYTDEFLKKVSDCYHKNIPHQRKTCNVCMEQRDVMAKTIKIPVLGKLGQLMKRYDTNLDKCYSPDPPMKKACQYMYTTPNEKKNPTTLNSTQVKMKLKTTIAWK